MTNQTEFELRLRETVDNYFRDRMEHPKSVSMSEEFYPNFLATQTYGTPIKFNNNGQVVHVWRGLTVKFVRRRNYMEAMPRAKKRRKGEKVWKSELLGTWGWDGSNAVFPSSMLSRITHG